MAKYRGKYPHRIKAVYSVAGVKGIRVQINDGTRFDIAPLTHEGRAHMPKCNEDMSRYLTNTDYYVIRVSDTTY